jgi:hypothetical protein
MQVAWGGFWCWEARDKRKFKVVWQGEWENMTVSTSGAVSAEHGICWMASHHVDGIVAEGKLVRLNLACRLPSYAAIAIALVQPAQTGCWAKIGSARGDRGH